MIRSVLVFFVEIREIWRGKIEKLCFDKLHSTEKAVIQLSKAKSVKPNGGGDLVAKSCLTLLRPHTL